jgi:hypothetical protein
VSILLCWREQQRKEGEYLNSTCSPFRSDETAGGKIRIKLATLDARSTRVTGPPDGPAWRGDFLLRPLLFVIDSKRW